MVDRREEIFNANSGVLYDLADDPIRCLIKEDAFDALDQYMKECCLELLEYVGKKVKWAVESEGKVLFWNGVDYLTKEQLFENFL